MNMPGFTAEAALYSASTHYQMLGTATEANKPIHPAFGFPSSCAVICRPCEEAGGICIHLRNGRCACA
jgi:hypothetical protein